MTTPAPPDASVPTAAIGTVLHTMADRFGSDAVNMWPYWVPFLVVVALMRIVRFLVDLRAKQSVPQQVDLF